MWPWLLVQLSSSLAVGVDAAADVIVSALDDVGTVSALDDVRTVSALDDIRTVTAR